MMLCKQGANARERIDSEIVTMLSVDLNDNSQILSSF